MTSVETLFPAQVTLEMLEGVSLSQALAYSWSFFSSTTCPSNWTAGASQQQRTDPSRDRSHQMQPDTAGSLRSKTGRQKL